MPSDNGDSPTKKKRGSSLSEDTESYLNLPESNHIKEHLVSYLNLPVSEIDSPKHPLPAKMIEYKLEADLNLEKEEANNWKKEYETTNEQLKEAQKKTEEVNKER